MSNVSHAADWIGERRADNVALAPRISEDWLSLIIGLLIFALALAGLANTNLLGWVVTTSVWTNLGQALKTVSNAYGSLGGVIRGLTSRGARSDCTIATAQRASTNSGSSSSARS